MLKKKFLLILLNLIWVNIFAQTSIIYGKIKDENHRAIELANVSILENQIGTVTNKDGSYSIMVPYLKSITLIVSYVGYETKRVVLNIKPGQKFQYDCTLKIINTNLTPFEVKEKIEQPTYITRIDPKTINVIPSASGGIESILKTLPGVSSNNELSSQYSVRGGNFDENLVYVNDIEIYRPILVRSGQQEGLSFVNSDLVSSISFAAGGFEAKYGDKMSSVLDIQYKKPEKFAGSFQFSLLGGSGHLEGTNKNKKISYLLGVRQKNNKYLLNSLPTKGDYRPSFTDIQTFLIIEPSNKIEMNFLGNFSRNQFKLIPQTRETKFGTLNEALSFYIYFDGQEIDRFDTYMGAYSFIFKPKENIKLKIIASAFNTQEQETFDIQGQYRLSELQIDPSTQQTDTTMNLGIGTFLDHARNKLNANVYSVEHKGSVNKLSNQLAWGVKWQNEQINDKLDEWKMIDSAGFSIPRSTNNILQLNDVLKTKIALNTFRISGFIQNTWKVKIDSTKMSFTLGLRSNFWSFNQENVFGPRFNFSLNPGKQKKITLRAASGYYFQPPFYRELRNLEGSINNTLKAQRSLHFLLGGDWSFRAWRRPFKFTTEVYYKNLKNLIPYEIDNVRIRYYATNKAKGYATGVDFKINGEFVPGLESWISLSLMQTKEDILDDYYYIYYNQNHEIIKPGITVDRVAVDSLKIEPGYIPRPTDQRLNIGLFFQDYLPQFPTYKMHMNFLYGSRLPFGPPSFERYKDTLRIPPYLRVDIGFSKQLKSEENRISKKNPFHLINTAWLSLEVLNLLQSTNTISYLWVKAVDNRQYSIPNYMTPRQLNVKLSINF